VFFQYPFVLGLLIALAWAGLVAASRVYLGMHTAFVSDFMSIRSTHFTAFFISMKNDSFTL
jgi:hypothetical protein